MVLLQHQMLQPAAGRKVGQPSCHLLCLPQLEAGEGGGQGELLLLLLLWVANRAWRAGGGRVQPCCLLWGMLVYTGGGVLCDVPALDSLVCTLLLRLGARKLLRARRLLLLLLLISLLLPQLLLLHAFYTLLLL
jgi:hypothetical protein